jgi:superfamily II DNA or RNA helicase
VSKLEDLQPGLRLAGVIPGQKVSVIAVQPHGPDAVGLTYKTSGGELGERVLGRDAEDNLAIAQDEARPLNAVATDFKLVAECQRIKLAGLFDPMLAVTTSDIEPLPHQLRAVYGELVPRTPLRFLLADDPGAGKTIMAGLYIKELILREDVKRCLVVAPGGLVEQWQDELYLKFGLRFEILTRQLGETPFASAFDHHPMLIARMDQLARNDELLAELAKSEWDLVVVDEAHRMGAHYFAGKLEKTKRFQLGELLGTVARHLLLMTATPHSGKEEDFQLFLTLLDRDRFEGKYQEAVHTADTSGVMRRMVKEDLLTFEGKPLFPERVAETIPYELTELEQDLYQDVTTYVREGMNRAEKLDGQRRNTVGFALTVLQRRLASSPEAIYRSLERRAQRLERRKQAVLDGKPLTEPATSQVIDSPEEFDDDEYSAEELEQIEDELVDAATAARTVEELDAELADLRGLIDAAGRVRASGTDRKWSELRTILEDNTLATSGSGPERRKLIVFTEHRDTLEYLARRIGSLLARPEAVKAIHGGVRRTDRRQITEEFTRNPACQVLLATDAAGEGLNLQAAHLMVNYDLPWNPNRIEQRFGRIHRIGQREVCRLWNLVAENTREGEVFVKLLAKIEEQRKAYGGKVFDVLGPAFGETPLRTLLIEAIRYGELPETKANMEKVIDSSVAHGIEELLAERALVTETLERADIAQLRALMDEARARRLQPHYIEGAFRAAFTRLGGRIRRRERGRFEITHVPAELRTNDRGPIATRYERVTFDLEHVLPNGGSRADLLAPGHPLHDAVTDAAVARWHGTLERGTVLVSPDVQAPKLLVGVIQEIVDATDASVARRFGYAYIDEHGNVEAAGPAPYLDCVAAPALTEAVKEARELPWLAEAEEQATSWIIANQLPEFLNEVRLRRETELRRVREQVNRRLEQESNRLVLEAMVAQEQEQDGKRPRETHSSLMYKAAELEARRTARLALLDRQLEMQARPPRVITAALVLPLSTVQPELPADAPVRAVATKEVERRGVELVLKVERALGREPVEQAFNNPGFDVLSSREGEDPIRIEVKARLAGADDFYVTHNEVLTALNTAPRYRLALVRVDPGGPEHDEVRYLENPFGRFDAGDFDATGHRGKWETTWAKGKEPF